MLLITFVLISESLKVLENYLLESKRNKSFRLPSVAHEHVQILGKAYFVIQRRKSKQLSKEALLCITLMQGITLTGPALLVNRILSRDGQSYT